MKKLISDLLMISLLGVIVSCGSKPFLQVTGAKSTANDVQEKPSAFKAYCENRISEEIAYSIRKLKTVLKANNCEELESSLSSATNLKLVDLGIRDIEFLSFAPNLTILDLQYNSIQDLSALSKLKQLRSLDVSFNKIENIEALAQLPQLAELGISVNPVGQFSPLAQLKQLTLLKASSCGFTDLKPLSGLLKLESLSLADNQLTDLTPLRTLTRLKSLNVSRNPNLSDFSPVLKIASLTAFRLGETQTSDLSFLSQLPQLTELSVHLLSTVSLEPIGNLTKLNNLSIAYLQNPDLAPEVDILNLSFLPKVAAQLDKFELIGGRGLDLSSVAQMVNLTSLVIQSPTALPLSHLVPLTKIKTVMLYFSECDPNLSLNLPSLEKFHVTFVACPTLNPFRNLKTLKDLHLSFTPLAFTGTIDPLLGLSNLEKLVLSFTEVSDLKFLSNFPRLQLLNLYGTKVTDFTPLTGLPELSELVLSNNRGLAVDVEVLTGIRKLESLAITESTLSNPQSLQKMAGTLKSLELHKNELSNCSPVATLKGLQRLTLTSTTFSDLKCLEGLDRLDFVNVGDNANLLNIASLKGATDLRKLNLSKSKVASLSSLETLRFLEVVDVSSTAVNSLEPLKKSQRLQEVNAFDTPAYTDANIKKQLCSQSDLNDGLKAFCEM